MMWKDEDEVTTTFATIKLASSQSFEMGAEFERGRIIGLASKHECENGDCPLDRFIEELVNEKVAENA